MAHGETLHTLKYFVWMQNLSPRKLDRERVANEVPGPSVDAVLL